MGTTCIPDITTRKDMIQHILDDYRYDNEGYTLLDHSARGNELYLLLRHPKGYKFIGMYKLSGGGRENGWCYKAMDESMGPNYYNCPERILAESEDTSEYGTRWREDCRRIRKEQAARKAWASTLSWGDTVQVFRGWKYNEDTRRQDPMYRDVVFCRTHSPTFFVGRYADGTTVYRFRWSDVEVPDEIKEAA